jgi:small subunit ribosomal protein S17
MADDTENETPENTGEQAPEAEAQAPEPTEAAIPEAETPEVEAPEDPATEAPASPAGQESPAAQDAPAAPEEQLSSKERRRKARSTHSGEARPARSPEDRHAERLAERRAKATRRSARRLQERAKRTAKRESSTAAPAQELAPVHAAVEGKRTVRQGIVVSDKADKTITVRIDFARRHRRYEKIVRSSSTLHAHDESNDAHEGDTVRVIESRPLSKNKRWKLVDVLERAR